MINNVDTHILEMNYLETLVGYIEDRTDLSIVLELNERIYKRPVEKLSKVLIAAVTPIHKLKVRMDRGEHVEKDEISITITDAMLKLTSPHDYKK